MSRNAPLILAASFAVLSIVALGLALSFRAVDERRIDELSRETHEALCAFKTDLRARYLNGVQFLQEHPNGIPGISAADIQRSLSSQKATLDSLASLECEQEGASP